MTSAAVRMRAWTRSSAARASKSVSFFATGEEGCAVQNEAHALRNVFPFPSGERRTRVKSASVRLPTADKSAVAKGMSCSGLSRKDSQSKSSLASKKSQIFTSAAVVTGIPRESRARATSPASPPLLRVSTAISPNVTFFSVPLSASNHVLPSSSSTSAATFSPSGSGFSSPVCSSTEYTRSGAARSAFSLGREYRRTSPECSRYRSLPCMGTYPSTSGANTRLAASSTAGAERKFEDRRRETGRKRSFSSKNSERLPRNP